jgi:hypothetical protein
MYKVHSIVQKVHNKKQHNDIGDAKIKQLLNWLDQEEVFCK